MANKIQAIKGMHDLLPADSGKWQYMENTIQSVLESYGYHEIRLPVLEKTELFKRSIGEETDIVNKEMYTFADRNDELLTLRPEGTASCVRAVLEHNLLATGPLRTWYRGPMFRYERPQKGRFRQFHQVGAEVFGIASPDIDAELIILSHRLWRQLGISDLRLELNTLGSANARKEYRDHLVGYFTRHKSDLDDDSLRRLELNPLRILDSKNPDMQSVISNAPVMTEHLDGVSREHFSRLQSLLDSAGIEFQLNPRLVRGLDYYNHTVFEWITDALGAQGTICAGGRYDGLVEQFGGKSTPGVGFAMGLERIFSLLPDTGSAEVLADVYMIAVGAAAEARGLQLAEDIRDNYPDKKIVMHCGGGSFKSQFKRADKSGASIALLLGDDEIENNSIGIKPLRDSAEQLTVGQEELLGRLQDFF